MRTWIQRSLIGVSGAVLVFGLSACGSAPFGGDGPGGRDRGHGPDGDGPRMGMMEGHRHDGPRSEADMQKMRERMVERVTAQLELDAAQKEKFVRLLDTMHAQRQAMAGGAAARGEPGRPGPGGMLPPEQMKELVKGERFDRTRAQALVDERAQAARAAAPQVIAAMGDFYDSLKPAQQVKVREFLDRAPMGRGFFGGHRHG